MTWRPDPRIRIGGVDVTEHVLGTVTIARGRDDVHAQPRAGYATIDLLDVPVPTKLTDRVTIDLLASSTPVRVFTGTVSDVVPTVTAAGSRNRTVVTSITAIGPIAKVHRGVVNPSGYPQQRDGDRVAAVLEDAVATRWETVQGELRWTDLEDETWQTIDPAVLDELDRPGVYLLQADNETDDPWRIAQQAAQDGGGVIYETATGRIGYADSTRRLALVQEHGYVDLPHEATLALGFTSSTRFGDLANALEVTYSTGTIRVRDEDAIRDVGAVLEQRISTRLLDQGDAEDRADVQLALRSRPSRSIEEITVAIDDDQLTDPVRDALFAIDVNTPLRLTGVPAAVVPSPWTGFVEGVEWEITRHRAVVTYAVSAYALSTFGGRWTDLPDELEWTDTPDTVTWLQAEELIP